MQARRAFQDVTRRRDADPVEVALRVQAFHEQDLDVDAALLRVDALADLVRTGTDGPLGAPPHVAARLHDVLVGELGYRGDPSRRRTARDALMADVLERRHGLPVTLAALWAGVGRRLGAPAYVVNLPGHVVVGIGDGPRPVLVDAHGGGTVLDESDADTLVRTATAGAVRFTRALVRPATPADLARRILNNLVLDVQRESGPGAAIWTIVARLALPDPDVADHLRLGELLEASGRFDRAAQAFDRYLEISPDGELAQQARHAARRARSRTN